MSKFAADWLALRERVDAGSRSARLADVVGSSLPRDRVVSAIDLASGTGSNVRYLVDRLPAEQDWLLVDADAALIGQVRPGMRRWAEARGLAATDEGDALLMTRERLVCRLNTRRLDLVALDANLFNRCDLVAASALLDLVSDRWLRDFVDRCRASRPAVLFSLTYDGRIECSPEEPGDTLIRDCVNRHQRTDKGFGPALGPDAAGVARRHLMEAGYLVEQEASDWRLSPEHGELQRQLVDGWAMASAEVDPGRAPEISAWRDRRLAHIESGRSHIIVGHADVAAFRS